MAVGRAESHLSAVLLRSADARAARVALLASYRLLSGGRIVTGERLRHVGPQDASKEP